MDKIRILMIFAVMACSSLQIFGIERNDTVSLNEKWLFKVMKCESEVPIGFQSETFNDSQWFFMDIPGQWTDQRYAKDWTGFNHVGIYRGWVKYLPKWKNRKVMLHIGNTTSEADIFVNGQLVGKTSRNLATSEFDVTDCLHRGRNLYAFKMKCWDEDGQGSEKDWTPGITSSCYLYTVPTRTKVLPIDTLGLSLDSLSVLVDSLRADSIRFSNDSIMLADSVARADSLEALAHIPPRVMKVLIADRYSIEPSKGYVDTKAHMLESIRMMKHLNFNAVSFNKASSDPLFVKLCRQNGLRVVDEPPTFDGRLIDDNGDFTYLAYGAIHRNQYVNGYVRDLENGKFIIANNDTVNDQRLLKIDWTIYVDGISMKKGTLSNQLFTSMGRKEITFPHLLAGIPSDKEALLKLEYHNQEDDAILGFDMYTLKPYNYQEAIAAKEAEMLKSMQKPSPKVKKKGSVLEIFDKNGFYHLSFDLQTGMLNSYEVQGETTLVSLRPSIEASVNAINKVKANKKTGTDVNVVFTRKDNGRYFVFTYHISPSGALSVSANEKMGVYLEFPPSLRQKQYYAKDEFRPVLNTTLTDSTDLVRWWCQTDGQKRTVWMIGQDEYQLKPKTKPNEMEVELKSKDFKLWILTQKHELSN